MSSKKYVRAEEGENNSVVYFDEDGDKLVRHWKRHPDEPVEKASTRSWRNNNPGNLIIGPFARKQGAIGEAGRTPGSKVKFAVFPDYGTGRKAQATRLKEGTLYIDLTLEKMAKRYVGVKPDEPHNQESQRYCDALHKMTKFDMSRTVRSLSDEEYEKLLDAMKRHEGWREGFEEYITVKKVINVRLNSKKTISEFLIGDASERAWYSKAEAIALAERGLLHAIVIHAKRGIYLRPEHHYKPFKSLVVALLQLSKTTV
jgi:hypothetical protein